MQGEHLLELCDVGGDGRREFGIDLDGGHADS
jgi:hypothetical protein